MEITGLILFFMLPAAALVMLKLGVGVFGHPSLYHHHIAYKKKPVLIRGIVEVISYGVLLLGFLLMVGIIDLGAEKQGY